MPLLATVVVLAGCAGSVPGDDALVTDYCRYGVVSEAQLDGCLDHVTADDIDNRDTNAARYARGDLSRCLADAGPFCEPR